MIIKIIKKLLGIRLLEIKMDAVDRKIHDNAFLQQNGDMKLVLSFQNNLNDIKDRLESLEKK